jgi:hypothetical protein
MYTVTSEALERPSAHALKRYATIVGPTTMYASSPHARGE